MSYPDFIIRGLIVVCLISTTAGCTNWTSEKSPEITVNVNEPAHIRFSGKGAGAGMMLSSSMGPMGIAIGVAIDEGIAKQIDENAAKGNFSIEEVIVHAFGNVGQDLAISVQRYGFVLARGDYPEDRVIPELELVIQSQESGEPEQYYFPRDYKGANSEQEQTTWSLEAIKSDPEAVTEAFQYAAQALAGLAFTP